MEKQMDSILGEFKRFFITSNTRHNEDNSPTSSQNKATFHLPKFFNKNVYDMFYEFMGSRPIFTPPCVQDLDNDHDTTFNPNSLNPIEPTNNTRLIKEDIDLTNEDLLKTNES
jgi:hypothetical protein